MIYDHLFYKAYLVSKRSRNFNDSPLLPGIMWVSICLLLNLSAVIIYIEGLLNRGFQDDNIDSLIKYKYVVVLIMLIVGVYYKYNNKWKRVIEKYTERDTINKPIVHPLIIVVCYYVVSGCLLLIAGMFKNKQWIFQ